MLYMRKPTKEMTKTLKAYVKENKLKVRVRLFAWSIRLVGPMESLHKLCEAFPGFRSVGGNDPRENHYIDQFEPGRACMFAYFFLNK